MKKIVAQIEVPILYEDKDFLVVNKPAGLVVHADGKTLEYTLADWLVAKYPKIKEVGEPIKLANGETLWKPGIVHRLDRDTSGVLLVAKHQEAYEFAKKQFQERETAKTYRAFVYGRMKLEVGETGKVDRPIGRSKNDFRKWTAERGARGEMREAITEFTVLKKSTAGGAATSDGFTYLEVRPLTGRTHQIRVHLKAINHPVVGDTLYAPNRAEASKKDGPANLGLTRLALHALLLEFTLMNGKQKEVTAPLPADFDKAEALLV